MEFSNGLSKAEAERLYLLVEECGEIQQLVGKILRHGYDSRWPRDGKTNRDRLNDEIGDFYVVYKMMCDNNDINVTKIWNRRQEKIQSIKQWLHFQEDK